MSSETASNNAVTFEVWVRDH